MDQAQTSTIPTPIVNPRDFQPAEIEVAKEGNDWKTMIFVCIVFAIFIFIICTVIALFLDMKYQLKYNCLPRDEIRQELIRPIQ